MTLAPAAGALIERDRQPDSLTMTLDPAHARALCAGHFPGDPLIPGSMLLGLAVDVAQHWLAGEGAAARRVAHVERATFVAPARPTLAIELTARHDRDPGCVHIDVRGDAQRLASIRVRVEPAS